MASTVNGLTTSSFIPAVEYSVKRDSIGKYTASLNATCLESSYHSGEFDSLLKKGTPITDVSSHVPSEYSFLTVVDHEGEPVGGGFFVVSINFAGARANDPLGNDGGGSSEPGEESSTSTNFRGTTNQGIIIEHPKFIEAMSTAAAEATASYFHGESVLYTSPSGYSFSRKVDGFTFGDLEVTDPVMQSWIDLIRKGVRVYHKSEIEYTITYTNKLGMTDIDLRNFNRRVAVPPGNPPRPNWFVAHGWWHFSGINETKDENSSVYSKTYTLRDSVYEPLLYDA